MVWAQKSTRVLVVGMGHGVTPLAFGPHLTVLYRTFAEAEAALQTGTFAAVVIDPGGHAADAQALAARARILDPNVRVIFTGRHTAPDASFLGERLIAGNGRQFARGLRAMLGC